jgi:tRNA(adenine34) deaminase
MVYTTTEACPMCMSAIVWCGVDSAVYGTSIPTLMELGCNQINIRATNVVDCSHRPKNDVVAGVLTDACDELFEQASAM